MPAELKPGDLTLKPGELFVGAAPQRVRTLLGSCVTVTLWHRARRAGAMCHFLLPERGGARVAPLDGRYADEALDWMAAELRRRAVPLHQCEAKLFGGGRMFAAQGAGPDVGRRNGEAARRLLAAQGLAPASEDLFGSGHRQLLFDLATGAVWCQFKHPAPETR
jgi:chemotaxis protein CheD